MKKRSFCRPIRTAIEVAIQAGGCAWHKVDRSSHHRADDLFGTHLDIAGGGRAGQGRVVLAIHWGADYHAWRGGAHAPGIPPLLTTYRVAALGYVYERASSDNVLGLLCPWREPD